MDKNKLKSLVTDMYENLLSKIDNQDDSSKENLVELLKEATDVISTLDEDQINSITAENHIYSDAYKKIAKESLESYETTNAKFQELTAKHQDTIQECQEPHIDLPKLTEKFNEIQRHMEDEVSKANLVISELTQQVKTLEEKSNLDPLTKVFNRRALSSYLRHICSQKNIPYELHLMILDLDDFKEINDTHGHLAGDKVLIFIANILKKTLRDGDKIFRYGGEEFIIILNRIDTLHCRKIIMRLLELVRSNKLIYKGENLHVTMSVGATKLRKDDTYETILSRADAALYAAKKNGKNQMYSDVTDGI
ncbi:MAG: GGDEF domain-containing protein [Sulfurimonas sp.]|nr:GGDEF domain-containing protein [Sulfurimonas sp.]